MMKAGKIVTTMKGGKMLDFKATLSTGNGSLFVNIGKEIEFLGRTLSHQEISAVALIAQIVEKLNTEELELSISANVKDSNLILSDDVVRCEWMRSGNLMLRGKAEKHVNFCETPEEAISKKGVFTCAMCVYMQLPKNRKHSK